MGIDRESQLGADPVGSRHEHGLAIAIERDFHQRAESAYSAQHLAAHRALDVGLDSFDEFLAGVYIDSGLAIGYGGSLCHSIPSWWTAPAGRRRGGRGPTRQVGQLWYFTSGDSRLPR